MPRHPEESEGLSPAPVSQFRPPRLAALPTKGGHPDPTPGGTSTSTTVAPNSVFALEREHRVLSIRLMLLSVHQRRTAYFAG